MGKPTGFMEYERCEAGSIEPKERIKNFNEFHIFLSKENQQKQAARCMDCGVPFCQAGALICQPDVGALELLVESAYSTSVLEMPTPMRLNLITTFFDAIIFPNLW